MSTSTRIWSPRVALVFASCAGMLLMATGGSALARNVERAVPVQGAAPIRPALKYVDEWGWVTERDKTASSALAANDQGNWFGGNDTVSRSATGAYLVTLGGMGVLGGVPHVTALGKSGKYCDVLDWYESGDEFIDVTCTTRTGAPADSPFTLTYLYSNGDPGPLAYLWADRSGSAVDYAPDATYSFDSSGGTNTVHHPSAGDYQVTLPGLGSTRGDIQVTAYAGSGLPRDGVAPGALEAAPSCGVESWGPAGADMVAEVICRDPSGTRADARFDLTFLQGIGPEGSIQTHDAYLWANRARAASYLPSQHYRYSHPGGSINVTRQGTGRYTVTLAAMPKGGAVVVTAYGGGAVRCGAAGIRTDGTPQTVSVRCFRSNGQAVDSQFTLAYER